MKKLFIAVLVLAWGVTVQASPTPTNSVNIASLPAASTLSGTEYIPVDQAGTTKAATVAQVNAAAVGLVNADETLQTLAIAAVQTQVTQLELYTNQIVPFNHLPSNVLSNNNVSSYTLLGTFTGSGAGLTGIPLASVTGIGSIASYSASAFDPASNPNGYQNASQVSAAVGAGVANALLGITNGSASLTLSSLQYLVQTNLTPSGLPANGTQTNFVNMAGPSVQVFDVTNSVTTLYISPVNIAPGQNVTLIIYPNTTTVNVDLDPRTLNMNANIACGPSKRVVFNLTSFGTGLTNVMESAAESQ